MDSFEEVIDVREHEAHSSGLPPDQEAIKAKCFHPAGAFVEFKTEDAEQSIPRRFEQIVARYPDQIAVKTQSTVLSYEELNKAANRIANAILSFRSEVEKPVILFLDHDITIFPAMVALLKAGKICVVLDPAQPAKWADYLLNNCQAALIITDNKHISVASALASANVPLLNLDEIGANQPDSNLNVAITPDRLSFIIYSSGSTGVPKGVIQTHRAVLHNALRFTNSLHISTNDRVTLLASLDTSLGIPSAFCALLNGATSCVFNAKKESLALLAGWLIKEEITVYISASTVYRHLMNSLTGRDLFPNLRVIRLGAEQIRKSDVDLYKNHFCAGCIFVAALGSTECGAYCHYFIDKQTEFIDATVPVGYPAENMEIALLHEDGKEVERGEIGEIVVSSRYLSPGYWRNIDTSDSRLESNSNVRAEQIWRTGDLGRMRDDGCMEHCGRKGSRVKIRGFNVELEAIETSLSQHPSVRETVVEAKKDGLGDDYIVAYVVANDDHEQSGAALRRFLRERLSEQLIPSSFVFLREFPLTPIGKVDRGALPDPSKFRPNLLSSFVGPKSPVEQELTRIWVEIMSIDQIGIHDNFFDLGGHSIIATRIVSQIKDQFHLRISLQTFFAAPTIAEMAAMITAQQTTNLNEKELETLFAELDLLTDDEARRLLADDGES